ncbi:MAG: hypothetical protein LBO73_02770 [Holosporaceae bacterium]|jgi:hypothetical protein|nr:hypothetical protein [Holosporaceae bacterium]
MKSNSAETGGRNFRIFIFGENKVFESKALRSGIFEAIILSMKLVVFCGGNVVATDDYSYLDQCASGNCVFEAHGPAALEQVLETIAADIKNFAGYHPADNIGQNSTDSQTEQNKETGENDKGK